MSLSHSRKTELSEPASEKVTLLRNKNFHKEFHMSNQQIVRFCLEQFGFIPSVITEQHIRMAAIHYQQ